MSKAQQDTFVCHRMVEKIKKLSDLPLTIGQHCCGHFIHFKYYAVKLSRTRSVVHGRQVQRTASRVCFVRVSHSTSREKDH